MKILNAAPRSILAATGLALAISFAAPSVALAQGQPPAAPMPKILVIDRAALLRQSKVGQDIQRQVEALTKSAESELKSEGEALRREAQALQQQVAILSPEVKAQKIRAFEAKQAAFQQKVQNRQNQIRYGVALAQRQVEAAAGPIVQKILQQRGANLMLDRQMIVISAPGLDVTPQAIQALDQKLPSVKVQLVSPPVDVLNKMQRAQ